MKFKSKRKIKLKFKYLIFIIIIILIYLLFSYISSNFKLVTINKNAISKYFQIIVFILYIMKMIII